MTSTAAENFVLTIDSMADAGQAVGRRDGQVVFATGALPGETVRVRPVPGRGKASIVRAETIEVLEASERRVSDRRSLFAPENPGLLGGMEYSHASLAYSRELKAGAVVDQFARIGRLEVASLIRAAAGGVRAIAAPGDDERDGTGWRTRVQAAVNADGRLGAVRARTHDIVPVLSLPLATEQIADLGLTQLSYAGLARVAVALPASGGPGAVMLDLAAGTRARDVSGLAASLAERGVAVIATEPGAQRSGRNRGGSARRGRSIVLHGTSGLTERVGALGGREFDVSADGFWQGHREAPNVLIRSMLKSLGSSLPGRRAADLYCGAGLLSAALLDAGAASLVGIEGSSEAIRRAARNVPGATFIAGRVEEDLAAVDAGLEAVVLDPPRAGAGVKVVREIARREPAIITYVSCDAATLARDCAEFASQGYELVGLEVHDLFPLTGHVECVAKLVPHRR